MIMKYHVAAAWLLPRLPVRRCTGQSRTQARTPWGTPDLQGAWSFATVTPLERPAERREGVPQPPPRSQEIEKRAMIAATDEARGADAARDVAGAYNDFWWDRGTRVAGRRTLAHRRSEEWQDAAAHARCAEVGRLGRGERSQETRRGDLPASSYEDTDLWDRCLTRSLPIVPGRTTTTSKSSRPRRMWSIIHEMIHDVRIVPLDGRSHQPANVAHGSAACAAAGKATRSSSRARNFRALQELPFEPRMTAAGMALTERFSAARTAR